MITCVDELLVTGMSLVELEACEAVEGTVFDIQRYSLHDGPGLRTTVFFKGCPLRCGWCANPESQQMSPEIAVFAVNCISCGQFDKSCPAAWQAHADTRWKQELVSEFDTRAQACPARGVRWIGQRRTAGSIMAEVRRDVPFYQGDGGLTLSGGEPLLQPDLAEALLRLAHADCINTAIETTGQAPWRSFERCLPFLDTVLFDVKHLDGEIHRQYTGVDNTLILENLRHLARLAAPVIVRVPLIPGFNATAETIQAVAALVVDLNLPSQRVDLLPYHALGRGKYTVIGKTYPWADYPTLSDEQVAGLAGIVRSYGLAVTVGG